MKPRPTIGRSSPPVVPGWDVAQESAPLAFAREISVPVVGQPELLTQQGIEDDEEPHFVSDERYEEIKRGDSDIHIAELQRLTMKELIVLAKQENITEYTGLKKQDLIFKILKERTKMNGLMFGEGTLEILPDGFGFLRSPDYHYLPCPDDIYVSPSQIRRFGLRKGATVAGQIRPPKENERYFALLRVEAINNEDPNRLTEKVFFDDLTPLHPTRRLKLCSDSTQLSTRVVDIVAPIGMGQRGLIVSPPKAGKTILLQQLAKAVLGGDPDVYVIVLLIDERPEEVTEMRRRVHGEVVASSLDREVENHVRVSQLVFEKAKRMAESGRDVFLLLDSITRTARAFNKWTNTGRTGTGGLDVKAMDIPKKMFGMARQFDEGGSLTVVGTALIETGGRMDDAIFQEFKGTGNMEMVLSRELAERRIWPAIDVGKSGTRREEKILTPEVLEGVTRLRRSLISLSPVEAMEMLTKTLAKFPTNADFLAKICAIL